MPEVLTRYLTALLVVLFFPLTAIPCLSQSPTASPSPEPTLSPGPVRPSSPAGPPSTALSSTPTTTASTPLPGMSATDCSSCPNLLTEGHVRRLEEAASSVQEAANYLKTNNSKDYSFWGNVFTNVFSNRLDSLFFGNAAESKGLVALITAWLSLAAAIVKLGLAWAPAPSYSDPRSPTRRHFEIGLSLFLAVSAAFAVLAVHSGRAISNSAAVKDEKISAKLAECNDRLQASAATFQPGSISPSTFDSLRRIESAFAATRADTAAKLKSIQDRTDAVYNARVGLLTKLLVFFGFLGIAYLVLRSVEP